MFKKRLQVAKNMNKWLLIIPSLLIAPAAHAMDAAQLIKSAIEYWRDTSSYTEMTMTIHRPDWQRTMTMKVWTRGDKESLVRVVAPVKDAGNSTLLLDKSMWTFTPKINRIIKIPSSMMNQSWMGSDFSNKDISQSTDIVDEYTHTLINTEKADGHTIYTIQSIPKENAPVVWGKEVIKVRDDYVILEHTFYDQDMKPVRRMVTNEIKKIGGKIFATKEKMYKVDAPEEWTSVEVKEARFGINIPKSTFTLSNLRNPRD